MKKNQKGFTLVEVIVVAIIVAILAAVAVPLYLQYVTNSRSNAAANAAGSIATFCGACKNSSGSLSNTGTLAVSVLRCTGGQMGESSTNVPADITINITDGTSSGTVTGVHKAGGNTATFNY